MKKILNIIFIISLFSVSYSQNMEDIGAGVIDFLLRNPQTANRIDRSQSIALDIIGDLLRVEGDRKHQLEYASSGRNQITINTGNSNQAQFVRTVEDSIYLLVNDVIYPISQGLIHQAMEIENNSAENYLSEPNRKFRTSSGLLYKIINEGYGDIPTDKDQVIVHCTWKLSDRTVIDSSIDRGEPFKFVVGTVIKGWQEALQLMKVGSKWEIVIPPNLAYGERGVGKIPPNSTLIIEVELLRIENNRN